MVHQANTPVEVVHLIRTRFPSSSLIGIDGHTGSGKSTLATAMANDLGYAVVEIDNYIARERGGYIPYLNVGDLRGAVDAMSRPLIIEGVCLLNVLELVNVKIDVLIYVRRFSEYGFWYEQDECEPEEPEQDVIDRLRLNTAAFAELESQLSGDPLPRGEGSIAPLHEEIVRYHSRYRPSKVADIFYDRVEN